MFYPAFLLLENNILYKGWSLFDQFKSSGEIVFNTGMTGYQEIMTDPSYAGQMITFTYPELGNTGLNILDSESKLIYTKGIIAKNICLYPSNWRSNISLKDYIILKRIPHIFGIDTRSLTRYIRSNGVINGYISSHIESLDSIKLYKPLIKNVDLVKQVTSKNIYMIKKHSLFLSMYSYLNYKINMMPSNKLKIVIIDFGVKCNILYRLLSYGFHIVIVPITCNYHTIYSQKPDAIVLSNGPGDPALLQYGINLVNQLINFANIPIFGICMGHQILSLALGAQTFKLKFGHRGINHPVGLKQKSEITSQNHGFAVNIEYLNSKQKQNLLNVSHLNFNDTTIAGILHANKPIFSVQYHPESSPGPHDSDYLFNIFMQLVYFRSR
uniref:Carbamoyl phosphate synthase small chain n=1 Tax=Pleonosporium borreri TaxID=2575635 RepID=A0A4D6WVT1_9FLOR|nr:Carbamoyl phosphate synthase small subunit [Pleonosporium borreri]